MPILKEKYFCDNNINRQCLGNEEYSEVKASEYEGIKVMITSDYNKIKDLFAKED